MELNIVSWNVNSINARIDNLIFYLKNQQPDILFLQELKCEEEKFPYKKLEEFGYNIAISGQKTYNGVAIFSKYKLENIITKLPSFDIDNEDNQARFIKATININDQNINIASIYVPNGGSALEEGQKNNETAKFKYKINFFQRLYQYCKQEENLNNITIFGGDYNVANQDIDVYDVKHLDGSICFHFDERREFNKLLNLGYLDSFRMKNPENQSFSWWDYRQNSYKYNKGMRIDYLLTSPLAADKIIDSKIDEFMSQKEKPSDHAPVVVKISL